MGTYAAYKDQFDVYYNQYTRNKTPLKQQPLLTMVDSPWSLGDLDDNLRTARDKIAAVKPEGLVRVQSPYIPYGIKSIKECCRSDAHSVVNLISQDVLKDYRRYVFYGTRAEATMYQVLRDFLIEKRTGKSIYKHGFKFPGYALRTKKGNEEKEMLIKYAKAGITAVDDVYSRAVRDYYFSYYLFTHMRNFTVADLSVASSVMCLTSMIDYVGALDDPGVGGYAAYQEAMLDGFSAYEGSSFCKVLDDVIMTTTFLKYKDDETKRYLEENEALPPAINRVVTPCEFWEVRWWDAAMSPLLEITLLSAAGAGIPVTKEFAPIGTAVCPFMRMSVDATVRFNELIDVHHDINNNEPINELHVAARYGGFEAVQYYGLQASASVDDGCVCKCGITDEEHDWGTDMALGVLIWYPVVPHYRAFTLFVETRHHSEEKYRGLVRESKHAAFVTCRYPKTESKLGMMFDENWKSIYKMEKLPPYKSGECAHCKRVSTWLLTRCLYRDRQALAKKDIDKFVAERIHLVDDVEMKGFWGQLVTLIGGDLFPLDVVHRCAKLVDGAWELFKKAMVVKVAEDLIIPGVELHTELEQCLMFTHQVNDGHILRRAMVGSLSSILCHTNLDFYQRILESCF